MCFLVLNYKQGLPAGLQPYPDDVLHDIYSAAIRVLIVTDNKQPLLDTLSLFFALLKPINTTALSNLVATSFQGSLFYEGLEGRMGPGFTSEALLVASALSSQTLYEAFVLVCFQMMCILIMFSDILMA